MPVFGFLRPKWQHPDPAIRLAAIDNLSDQAVLAKLVEDDPDETVRLTALNRLTDQDCLAAIAKSKSPLNVRAATMLTDQRLLASVACEAPAAVVREAAVGRLDDKLVLQKVAGQDPDAAVRMQARARELGTDGMHRVLKHALAKLEIGDGVASGTVEIRGSLDEVCTALLRDRRFQINGVVTTPSERGGTVESNGTGATGTLAAVGQVVELLACKTVGSGDGQLAHFSVQVWRPATDMFHCRVEERNQERRHDLETWSRSSSST